MAEQALSCINALLESVPTWIAEIETILKTSREKQLDLLAEQQPAEPSPPPPPRRRKLSKTSSAQSQRSNAQPAPAMEGQEHEYAPRPHNGALLRPQMPHMTETDELRLSQRKRKTFSVCSADPSAEHKYRSQAMVVVFYDGDTQKRFADLVRSIGASRNGVRKCMTSGNSRGTVVRPPTLATETSEDSRTTVDADGNDESDVFDASRLNFRTARVRRPPQRSDCGTGDAERLGKVDNLLEDCEKMCERAAHQILRDGDCTLELDKAKEHLDEAKKLAEDQLPDLQRRSNKIAAQPKHSSSDTLLSPSAGTQTPKLQQSPSPTLSPAPSPLPLVRSDEPLQPALEADDSAEEEEFVPPPMSGRLSKWRPQSKSNELIAH